MTTVNELNMNKKKTHSSSNTTQHFMLMQRLLFICSRGDFETIFIAPIQWQCQAENVLCLKTTVV